MMNRTYVVLLIVVLLVAIIAAVFMLSSNDKEEYPIVSGNEGLLGTASFEVADTEHSGTWVKGTAFAIDKGDRILLRVIGETEMKGNDSEGVKIETAVDKKYAHPLFMITNAYSSWEKGKDTPGFMPNRHQLLIGFSLYGEKKAIGGGTFVVDFESTDRFDRSQGKVELAIGAGSYFNGQYWIVYPAHELVTIQLKNDN
jgi:hypothetical protein